MPEPAAAESVEFTDLGATPDVSAGLIVAAGVAVAASLFVVGVLVKRWRRGQPLVEPRPHEPVPWNGIDVLVVLFLYLYVATIGGVQLDARATLATKLAVNMLVGVVTTLFGAAYLVSRGGSVADLGLVPGRLRTDCRLAVGAVALVVAPLLALAGLLERLVPYQHDIVDFLLGQRDARSIGLVLLAAVVVAPIFEEFFFRRVLQGWLEKRLPSGPAAAVLGIPAAAFALAHYDQGLAFVPLFGFALVLGYLARQTGSLPACILMHGLFNAVSVGLLLAQGPIQPGG